MLYKCTLCGLPNPYSLTVNECFYYTFLRLKGRGKVNQRLKNMAKRKSFIVYLDWREKCSDMTAEEKLSMIEAIFDYVESGVMPDFSDRYMKAKWEEFKRTLDADGEKYDAICKRNQANGKHGGRPKKEKPNGLKEEPKKPNGLFGLIKKPNETQGNPKNPISDNLLSNNRLSDIDININKQESNEEYEFMQFADEAMYTNPDDYR